MTDLSNEKLRALLEAATPGPWEATRGFVRAVAESPGVMGDFTVTTSARWVAECALGEGFDNGDANAALITLAPSLAAEVMALRAERERLRGAVEHARGALIGLARMECDDRDENESDNDDAWSDGYDNAVDKVETRAWAAVEWIDAALSGEPQP